jgi:hypothetical protein
MTENKIQEYSIKTTIPFPLVKLNVNLTYATVSKASGVGFILLVLIKEAKSRNEKLCDMLKRFGVPADLHFVFADELSNLVHRHILQMTQWQYDVENFDDYEISDFKFTSDGERIFRDGAIPTGEEKAKPVELYYNPITLSLSLDKKSKQNFIEESIMFPKGFMENIPQDFSGVKDFLIDNAQKVGLKKEERVLNCEIKNQENIVVREEDNVILKINDNSVDIDFNKKADAIFYDKYFSADMLERCLLSKSKFQFSVPTQKFRGFDKFGNINNLYLPENYDKQLSRSVKLHLNFNQKTCKARTQKDIEFEIDNKQILQDNYAFIAFDSKEARGYIPANIELKETIHNQSMKINLLIEELLNDEQKSAILSVVAKSIFALTFDLNTCEFIKTLSELSQNQSETVCYADDKLNEVKSVQQKANILIQANNVFSGDVWKNYSVKTANELYNTIFENLDINNFKNSIKTVFDLSKLTGNKQTDILESIRGVIAKIATTPMETFNLLIDSGFNVNETLSVANIIPLYVSEILSGKGKFDKTVIANDFQALHNNLQNLKENIGIINTVDYAFKQDYDKQKFIDEFKAYKLKLSEIAKYSVFAPEQFRELTQYENIMQPVFDFIMIERNASANPDKISEKYINDTVNNGDYRTAIGDLVIRLDFVLTKRVGVKEACGKNLADKINLAKEKSVISKDTATTLHSLRELRNQLQHPTNKAIEYNKEKLILWTKMVFSIKEKEDKK